MEANKCNIVIIISFGKQMYLIYVLEYTTYTTLCVMVLHIYNRVIV